jgi:archaemetzincin
MITTRLEAMPLGGVDKVVGIVDVDLFVPVFTHVFGEARQGGRAALVSQYRMGADRCSRKRRIAAVWERTAKVALHEICHLYDLSHCMDTACLMHFSGDLPELDRTPLFFCRYCTAFLRSAVRRGSAAG